MSLSVSRGPPAAPCAEQGEAGRQQQGHGAAGESLLPSLARSRWERDWDLINGGTRPERGGTRGAGLVLKSCQLLQSCSANKEKSRGKRKGDEQLRDNPLNWTSLKLSENCLKSLKNAAAVLRNWAALLQQNCIAGSSNSNFKQRLCMQLAG